MRNETPFWGASFLEVLDERIRDRRQAGFMRLKRRGDRYYPEADLYLPETTPAEGAPMRCPSCGASNWSSIDTEIPDPLSENPYATMWISEITCAECGEIVDPEYYAGEDDGIG